MAAKQTKHDIEPGIVADLVMDMITGTRVVLEELGDVPIQNQTTCLQLVMLGIRRGAFYAVSATLGRRSNVPPTF